MSVVLVRGDGAETSDPRAYEQSRHKRTRAGQQVHGSGAGEVGVADF